VPAVSFTSAAELARADRQNGRILGVAAMLAFAAVVVVASAYPHAAFAADPFEHLTGDTGGVGGGLDPQGDSWLSIRHSAEQFLHLEFLLRLFLSLALAVACAWVVAWHPRTVRSDSLSFFEAQKTLVLLGVVGATVSELSLVSHTLALVIFGIGALLRFRTVLDNPKLTGKAIMVVVIGLACGIGSWAMAVFVTAFTWVLIYWLDSHVACRLLIRLARDLDPEPVFGTVHSLLISRGCRLQSSTLYKSKSQLVFLLQIPAALDLSQLKAELRGALPQPEEARIEFEVA
jgi:hypothetical protein